MLDHTTLPANPAEIRPRILLAILLVVGALGLAADQAGKAWAFAQPEESAELREIAPGVFAGAQGRNYGAMFSVEGEPSSSLPRILLATVGFVAVALLVRGAVLDRNVWRPIHAVGGGLVIAGALGNQVDRLMLGYVRDYLVLRIHPQGIFNTADVFMVLGALLLALTWTARSRCTTVALPAGRAG